MDFYALEATDGVRYVWNNIPSTKLQATRAVLQQGVHYTPFKDLENLATVEYDPLRCKCGAILNPSCQVDFRSKFWICPFCQARNPFPQSYAQHISEKNLPAELTPQYSTIEYVQGQVKQTPNIFLYVIDTCVEPEQLNALRDTIQQSLNIIPPETYVGLITYGKFVFVHELGFGECPKSYALKGSKDYTPQQIQEMLGINTGNDPRAVSYDALKRFLLPLTDCEFALNSILDDLQADPWLIPPECRPQVATGCALNTAISLLEKCPYQGSRIMLFVGNPCTIGPGQVVDIHLKQTIRGYLDIQKEWENTQHIKKATKFYQSLTQRAIRSQQIVDIYGFTIDQFGLMEMKSLSEKTGGYIVMQEEFKSDVFRESYKKLFDKDPNTDELKLAGSAKTDLYLSKEIKVSGAFGNCTSLKKTGPQVSETELGQGGTMSWYIGGLDKSTTITYLLDLSSQNKETNNSKLGFFQFQTIYKVSSGKTKLRVTTVSRRFAETNNFYELAQGFDQEAACVMMARLGCLRAEQEEPIEVLKWLDRTLIRLVCRFAEYKKDDPNSFRLSKEFSLYPQFMYNLRRSHFIQTFGASPDEISFYRSALNRENVTNCIVMIQPALLQYNFDQNQPVPVMLDQSSMKNNVILLLDTYFQVCVWYGDHIKKWYQAKYQEQEGYESFKELLEAPEDDVKLIMEDRFPVPKYFLTWEGHTKERYLKSRVNPSGLDNNMSESGHYITDDASLKLFMDHLIKLAVSQQSQ